MVEPVLTLQALLGNLPNSSPFGLVELADNKKFFLAYLEKLENDGLKPPLSWDKFRNEELPPTPQKRTFKAPIKYSDAKAQTYYEAAIEAQLTQEHDGRHQIHQAQTAEIRRRLHTYGSTYKGYLQYLSHSVEMGFSANPSQNTESFFFKASKA